MICASLNVQDKDGKDIVKEFAASKALQLGALLEKDPELDGHLESAADFLQKQGLQAVSSA